MATTPPATQLDTTNVVGEPGAAPLGATPVSGSNADTEATTPGNAPNPAAPAATQPDTSGAGTGSNLPSNYHPTDTSANGTIDTVTSDGNVRRQATPTYRAPSATPAAAVRDTTLTDILGVGPAPANTMSLYAGTIETASIGSATPAKTVTENLLFNTTGNTLSKTGVLPAATVTVVNKGQIIAVVGESHAAGSPLAAFTLTNNGVVSTAAQVVVKKGTTTLVQGTDYTITPTGSGATANFSILGLDSAGVDPGDTFLVSYSYGNAKYFANATLTPTTDYTKTYAGEGANITLKITRVNTAASTNGDTVAVTYTYGDTTYYESNAPASVPGAPTIGAVTAKNKRVTVNWTAPSGQTDINYYVVQCVPGYGQQVVPANLLKVDFTQLTPAMPYKFQVAAVNSAGQGAWSALSATATPLNTDAVPTGSLAPENVVNPIYNIDGTVKAGTGLGPS
jgi:hypothetical protein